MNGYELTKIWYGFKVLNTDKVRPIHSDMYFYIINLWNIVGQKNEFGLPTTITMENLGIGSYKTYKKTLDDLISFGFIEIISDSKNQHHSKVVALVKNAEASTKASTEASIKATTKASTTIIEPIKTGKNSKNKKENVEKEKKSTTATEEKNDILFFEKETQPKIEPWISPTDSPTVEEIENGMRSSRILEEAARKSNKISQAEYLEAMEMFFLEKRGVDKPPRNESDHKQHFLNWLRSWVIRKNQTTNNPPKGKIQNNYDSITQAIFELNGE